MGEVSAMRQDDGGVNEASTRGGVERSCVRVGLEEACGHRCRSQTKMNMRAQGGSNRGDERAWRRRDKFAGGRASKH